MPPLPPQGSLLGSGLFIIYKPDFPRQVAVHIVIFADDTALYTSSRSEELIDKRLHGAIEYVMNWSSRWTLPINESEYVAIRFLGHRVKPYSRNPDSEGYKSLYWNRID